MASKRIMMVAAVLLSGSVLATSPAMAQDQAGDRVRQVDVFGDEPCPAAEGDEILVCVRRDEEDRFRIPENLRSDPNSPANTAWTERVRSFERVGATGTDSCSPVGPGGFTGCIGELINSAYAERRAGSDVRAGQLISEARQERLSNIDRDAEAVEAREREIEAELEERRAEREAALEAMRAQAEGRDPKPRIEGDPDIVQPPQP